MAIKLTVDSFLNVVKQSKLVPPDALQRLLSELKTAGHPLDNSRVIGEELVKRDLLTRWQADKLLQGKHKGFFLGKYRLLSLLGKGGMSSVYLADHVLMRRRCAIKVLPAKRVNDSSYLGRFHREAQACASLDHPNIVRAYDVDKEVEKNAEIHFLVMEYVEGRSLQEMVQQDGVFNYIETAEYLRQSAAGLAHAHNSGMVHRDIKPGNLLVDRTDTVKLLDMGLARFFADSEEESLTVAHDEKVLGTADYLAPEQALDSHSVDQRADLYSLGCTFYFVLTGHPPFTEGTLAQRLMAHQTKQPPSVTVDRPDIPADLLAIIEKMMIKEPDHRYQSGEEIQQATTDWLLQHAGDDWRQKNPALTGSGSGSGVGLKGSNNGEQKPVPVARPLKRPEPEAETTTQSPRNPQPATVTPAAAVPVETPEPADAAGELNAFLANLGGGGTLPATPAASEPPAAPPVSEAPAPPPPLPPAPEVPPADAVPPSVPETPTVPRVAASGDSTPAIVPAGPDSDIPETPPAQEVKSRPANDVSAVVEEPEAPVFPSSSSDQPGSFNIDTGDSHVSSSGLAGSAAAADSATAVATRPAVKTQAAPVATAVPVAKPTTRSDAAATPPDGSTGSRKPLWIAVAAGALVAACGAYFVFFRSSDPAEPGNGPVVVENDDNTNNDGTGTAGDPRKLIGKVINVGGSDAHFDDLPTALTYVTEHYMQTRLQKSQVIKLEAGKRIPGGILLNNADSLSIPPGIAVISDAQNPATLAPSGSEPVVNLDQVRDFRLENVNIDAGGRPVAVRVSSFSTGVQFKNVTIENFNKTGFYSNGAKGFSPPREEEIQLENIRFRGAAGAVGVRLTAGDDAIRNESPGSSQFRIANCVFAGNMDAGVVVGEEAIGIRVVGCVFADSTVGIRVDSDKHSLRGILIGNNTFYNLKQGVVFTGLPRDGKDLALHRNLFANIAGNPVELLQGDTKALLQKYFASGGVAFNLTTSPAATGKTGFNVFASSGGKADVKGLQFQSTDVKNAKYLKPKAGGPVAKSVGKPVPKLGGYSVTLHPWIGAVQP